jgi:hypothetical protein
MANGVTRFVPSSHRDDDDDVDVGTAPATELGQQRGGATGRQFSISLARNAMCHLGRDLIPSGILLAPDGAPIHRAHGLVAETCWAALLWHDGSLTSRQRSTHDCT